MMQDVSVRARLDEDLPKCVRALAAVHAADGYPACWPTDPARWLNPPGLAAAWVVEHVVSIAGHVGMVRDLDDPALTALTDVPAHRLASVTRLFVAPPARGRGIGARLMNQVSRCAVEQRLQLVLDVVDDGGPAVALYERLGWRLVDRRLADWTAPDGRRLPVRIYLAPERPSPLP